MNNENIRFYENIQIRLTMHVENNLLSVSRTRAERVSYQYQNIVCKGAARFSVLVNFNFFFYLRK